MTEDPRLPAVIALLLAGAVITLMFMLVFRFLSMAF